MFERHLVALMQTDCVLTHNTGTLEVKPKGSGCVVEWRADCGQWEALPPGDRSSPTNQRVRQHTRPVFFDAARAHI